MPDGQEPRPPQFETRLAWPWIVSNFVVWLRGRKLVPPPQVGRDEDAVRQTAGPAAGNSGL